MTTTHKKSNRALIAVAVACFGPFFLAMIWFYGGFTDPQDTINNGTLIEPPVKLEFAPVPLYGTKETFGVEDLQGVWTLLIVNPGACDKPCRRLLYLTRQLELALGDDINRVQRVFLAPAMTPELEKLLTTQHPRLQVLRGDALRKKLPDNGRAVYMIDPLGNLMMIYPDSPQNKVTPEAIDEDISRLLRYSSIG
ncbi:MAG TPA: hypothetical protein VFP95_01075 [Gammaproteobacteria bacterium]|nr:hypothetical protein [Gammaproteobacteria bacterium]